MRGILGLEAAGHVKGSGCSVVRIMHSLWVRFHVRAKKRKKCTLCGLKASLAHRTKFLYIFRY
ncbi:hypothetical protein SAEN111111_09010 [Saccharibacillus endophyticus]